MTTLTMALRRTVAAGLMLLAASGAATGHANEPVRVDRNDEPRVVVDQVEDFMAPSPDKSMSPDDAAALQAVEEPRQEQLVHVRFHCRVLTGPRLDVAHLGAALDGAPGKLETEELERTAGLQRFDLPAFSAFSGQAVSLPYDGRHVVISATIASDRRSVQLKISEGELADCGKGGPCRTLAASQSGKVQASASAAFYFEAAREAPSIPPPGNAIERIVLVTPELVVQEEEEELVNASR